MHSIRCQVYIAALKVAYAKIIMRIYNRLLLNILYVINQKYGLNL